MPTKPTAPKAPRLMPIPQIQGRGSTSPYEGKSVSVAGIITGIDDQKKAPGFFLQDRVGDNDAATSDGLFVAAAGMDRAAFDKLKIGQQLQVTGTVSEARDMTTIEAALKGVSKLTLPKGRRSGAASELPEPQTLTLPQTLTARSTYLESREGMLVSFPEALVLGPSSKYNNFTVASTATHAPKRDFGEDGASQRMLVAGDIGPKTPMGTGDVVTGISGPLGMGYDGFHILQQGYYDHVQRAGYPPKMWGDMDADDRVTSRDVSAIKQLVGKPAGGPVDPADLDGNGKISARDVTLAKARGAKDVGGPTFSIATMNTENFFDPVDAPSPIDDDVPSANSYESKLARLAGSIREQLKMPDMIALQEVENEQVLKDLVSRPELRGAGYQFALLPTNGHRSINPALLFRGDKVSVSNLRQAQKIIPISDDGMNAVGSVDPKTGAVADTKPLFSREPLLADVTVKGDGGETQDVTVIVNHLISKYSPKGLPTEPLRVQQGKFLNGLVKEMRTEDPNREIIVLGDMNDTPDSKSLKAMRGSAKSPQLVDVLTQLVPQGERFSYNYMGKNELIDHILTTPGIAALAQRAGVRHYNADVPESASWGTGPNRATDHDSPYAVFTLPGGSAALQAAAGAAAAQPAPKP